MLQVEKGGVGLGFAALKLYARLSTANMPLLGTGLYRLKILNASQSNSNRVRSVGLNSRLMRMSTSKKPGPVKRALRGKNGTLPLTAFPLPSTAPHVRPPSLAQTDLGSTVLLDADGSRLDMSASIGRPSCTLQMLETRHPPTMCFIVALSVHLANGV